MNAAIRATRLPHFTARGFWLPCNDMRFFRPEEDGPLLNAGPSLDGMRLNDRSATNLESLDASVYRRLITVLPGKGYDWAIPLFSDEPEPMLPSDISAEAHPTAALFVSRQVALGHLPTGAPVYVGPLMLIVRSDGHYLWLLRHEEAYGDHPEIPLSDPKLQRALDDHIYDVVGDGFYSHYHDPNIFTSDRDVAHVETDSVQ